MRWNTDKRYLEELEGAGIPVTPTQFLTPGDDPTSWHPHGHVAGDVVVKPASSCGSRETLRHRAPDDQTAIVEHVRALLDDGRVVMVQPYLGTFRNSV
ncbi:MAG: hypothetical protein KGP12_02895 [Actinomycetales bacterium]|nr:hypothetical protein [Actinomycetales bacterium]